MYIESHGIALWFNHTPIFCRLQSEFWISVLGIRLHRYLKLKWSILLLNAQNGWSETSSYGFMCLPNNCIICGKFAESIFCLLYLLLSVIAGLCKGKSQFTNILCYRFAHPRSVEYVSESVHCMLTMHLV